MDTIRFPLTFNVGGMSTHTEGSRAYYSQLIGNIAHIKKGDLPLRPDVGVEDIMFTSQHDLVALVVSIAQNVPEIMVTSIEGNRVKSGVYFGSEQVIVDFEVR